jgi:GT2 family glycosyltransferase
MTKISVITSLFNCEKYLMGYFAAVEKIENKEECEFLLLHNAPRNNELSIIKSQIEDKPWFRHIIITEQEGLYATWNRGVKLSNGIYCAVWNVDDIRYSDSLDLQAQELDKDPNYGLVTGYLNGTNVYGETGSVLYKHDSMDKEPLEVYRSCLVGCFPMWRKSVHIKTGFFDEQFKCVSDFDFQIRVALHYKIRRVNKSLGVYLENDPNKISSNGLQKTENNVIYLRYGVYEKVILHLVARSLKTNNKNIMINYGQVKDIAIKIPFNYSYRIKGLLYSFFMTPVHIAREIYHSIK